MKAAWSLALLACLRPIRAAAITGFRAVGSDLLLHDSSQLYGPIDFELNTRDDSDSSADTGPHSLCAPKYRGNNQKREVEIEYFDGNRTISRRTIPMPKGSTSQDINEFVRGEQGETPEFKKKFEVIVWERGPADDPEDMGTSMAKSTNSDKVSMGTAGLCGCTTLVIVSRRGAFMGHWWESISFAPEADEIKRYGSAEKAFEQTVLDGLKNGVQIGKNPPEQVPLGNYASWFEESDYLHAYLMVPDKGSSMRTGRSYKILYEDRWARMKSTIGEIIPALKNDNYWKLLKYEKLLNNDRRLQDELIGTVLLQYDPDDRYKDGRKEKSQKRTVMWWQDKKIIDDKWDQRDA